MDTTRGSSTMLRFHTLRRIRTNADLRRLDKVTEFYRGEFPSSPQFLDSLRERLLHPLKVGYAVTLVTAERPDGTILGFGFYDHFTDLGLSYLEYLVIGPKQRGQGVGGGIYEAIRECLVYDGSEGLLFDVNPDDATLPQDVLSENRAALRFYEKYDARPLEGVRFDYPPFARDVPPLLLVYDDLGRGERMEGAKLRAFVRRLYEVKYGASPRDPGAQRILKAIPSGKLPRRPLRYMPPVRVQPQPALGERISIVDVVASEAHRDHVVAERDHLERPLRMDRLIGALKQLPFVTFHRVKPFPDRHVLAVHDKSMVQYLKEACENLSPGEMLHPTVFPARRRHKPPQSGPARAGYYCFDTFTPLTSNAYTAARAAVDVALTAAERLRSGIPDGVVYALTRPPGHHAESDLFGGFCYFNNAAIAANRLAQQGRVALLDIDFHHGNGAQEIFWKRDDVLTLSIHGDPRTSYPFFAGFEHEKGEGLGFGHNVNLPLPDGTGDDQYLVALRRALARIEEYEPTALVVALGLDASKDDPSGSFRITRKGFHAIGREIAAVGLPTMLTQEGGYNLRHLGGNVTSFFQGWAKGRT